MLKRSGNNVVWKGMAGLLLMAVLLTAISGCASQAALALEAKDNGNQIDVQKGQTITIKLEANPTTGYTWEVVESEGAILRQVGETEYEAESDLIGAGGVQTLRFEAVEAGEIELRLVYHRPWETDVEPLETFSLQVTVK